MLLIYNVCILTDIINAWKCYILVGEMLISSDTLLVEEELSNFYNTRMRLTVASFQARHEGRYVCTAKNSLGEISSQISVYSEILDQKCYIFLVFACKGTMKLPFIYL